MKGTEGTESVKDDVRFRCASIPSIRDDLSVGGILSSP